MFTKPKFTTTTIVINNSAEGETIEQKVERLVNNNEPIDGTAENIYTERKDGVMPAYDIRTDRFELAVDAMDYVTKNHLAKREARIVKMNEKDGENGGETTSTDGTSN